MVSGPIITTLAVGAVASTAAVGPIMQVFDQMGLVMALMGSLGGASWSIANRMTPINVARSVLLGGLMAFGIGTLSPPILSNVLGVDISPQGNLVQTLASASFVVGFLQEMLLSKLIKGRKDE